MGELLFGIYIPLAAGGLLVICLNPQLKRGRWLDNALIEPLWRSVKYEEAYLRADRAIKKATSGILGVAFSLGCLAGATMLSWARGVVVGGINIIAIEVQIYRTRKHDYLLGRRWLRLPLYPPSSDCSGKRCSWQ